MKTTDINQIIEIPYIQLIPRNLEKEQKLNFLNTYSEKYQFIIEYYKNIDQTILDNIYCEIHHIVPKSCDGSNDLENLVKVPGGIHYILHCLLPNVYAEQNEFEYYQKTIFAWDRLRKSSNKHKSLLNINEESLEYQELQKIHRQIWSIKQKEKFSDPINKQKLSLIQKNRWLKHPELRELQSQKMKDRFKDPIKREIMRLGQIKRYSKIEEREKTRQQHLGLKRTKESREKQSKTTKELFSSKEMREKCARKGKKNGMYGRKGNKSPASKMRWIKNPLTYKSKYVLKSIPIPDGWVLGRYKNVNKFHQ